MWRLRLAFLICRYGVFKYHQFWTAYRWTGDGDWLTFRDEGMTPEEAYIAGMNE